jgi:hypothetical protein
MKRLYYLSQSNSTPEVKSFFSCKNLFKKLILPGCSRLISKRRLIRESCLNSSLVPAGESASGR